MKTLIKITFSKPFAPIPCELNSKLWLNKFVHIEKKQRRPTQKNEKVFTEAHCDVKLFYLKNITLKKPLDDTVNV